MKKIIFILLPLSLVILFSGCGSSDVDEDSANNIEKTEEDRLTVTDLEGNTIQLDETPENIIALSAGDLETIYALGGEAVGRPVIRGEVPEEFKDIPEVGTSNDVNIEKIISLKPDLVIAHPQLNAEAIPALEEAGIDVVSTGADTIEEIQSSIEMIGKALNKEEEAKTLVTDIDEKMNDLNTGTELRTLLVFGVPGTLMVALPDSLSGNMLDAVGGDNIANDFPELEDYPGYAQLDTEKILSADPEAIFLITPGPAEQAQESLSEEIEKNPAWKSVEAVKNDHIVQLPNELFGASPGAKIIDSLEYLHDEIETIENES